jgi:hypothetical protein
MKLTLFAVSFAVMSLSLGSFEAHSQDGEPLTSPQVSSSSTTLAGGPVKLDDLPNAPSFH